MASRSPARRSAGAAARPRKSGRKVRGKLAPRSQKRGLAAELIVLPPDAPLSPYGITTIMGFALPEAMRLSST